MSNVKLNVKRDAAGTVALFKNNKEVTSVEIKKDVNMEIEIGTGFNTGAQVSAFSLFNNVNGTKGSFIGTWKRMTPTDQPSPELFIETEGSTAIQVTDTDSKSVDALFFFSVQVTDGKATYDTDPELRVKKLNG